MVGIGGVRPLRCPLQKHQLSSVFAEVHGKSRMDQEEEENRPGDRRGESQQLSPWIAMLGMLLSDLLRLQFLA